MLLDTMSEGRHVWSHPETLALIDAWEERYDLLRSQRRTAHVHEEIRQALFALNVEKSIRQIVVKIDNLTQKYRKTKFSGKTNPTWIYYKRLDRFMGYQTRYSRRREMDIENQTQRDSSESEVIGVTDGQNYCPAISISNIQGNEWRGSCEVHTALQLSAMGTNSQEVANYREELMSIITNQLEVQRQSLIVQEKIITLMKNLVNPFESHVPKPEID